MKDFVVPSMLLTILLIVLIVAALQTHESRKREDAFKHRCIESGMQYVRGDCLK